MDDKKQDIKYLVIHTHMYQPPRENPFTGEVELEHSAKPYDNWNNRISTECYFPNLYGRIFDTQGNIVEMVNNYDYLNFNFGPTLLNWMEIYYPKYYEKLVETVKLLKEKKGFSPAIAQGYNHTILPLDNFSTKITQVYWGIRDFELRFGFKPEGLWLSETSVNEDVLRILIDYKIKYVILAPHQLSKAINLKTQKEDSVYPNRYYVWFDRDEKKIKNCSRRINIFVYDEELSKKIAFDNITFNSEIFAKEINSRYKYFKDNLLIIATDGETYGHHHKFADLTLSHSFKIEFLKYDIKVISLAEYLSIKEPEYEAEINPGIDEEGTSWSCAHGVRRWKGGCNCGDEGIYDTSWRFGLRSAMKWLGEVLNDIYFEEGKKLFFEIYLSRNNYIDVIRKKITLDEFLNKNLKDINEENKKRAKKLLTMVKYQMFSLTSCGWFFSDISRIETQQNLKYALKAISIAEELGYKGIEKGVTSLLSMSKSNFKDIGNGEQLYERLIKSSKISKECVESFLSIKTFLNGHTQYSNYIFDIKIIKIKELGCGTYIYSSIFDLESGEEKFLNIIVNFKTIENIKINIKYGNECEAIETMEEIKLENFNKKMQTEILKLFVIKEKQKGLDNFNKTFDTLYKIFEINRDMAFENLEDDFRYVIIQIININLINFLRELDFKNIDNIEKIMEKTKNLDFKIDYKLSNDITMLMGNFTTKIFSKEIDEKDIKKALNIFKRLNLHPLSFHLENLIYERNGSQKAKTISQS